MSIGQYFGNEPDAEARRALHANASDRAYARGVGGRPDRRRRGRRSRSRCRCPADALRCAGTTVVGVAPTHRRRGVLRAMMRAHLDDAHERGEPIAALWASEETIYGRFGYGPAAYAGRGADPAGVRRLRRAARARRDGSASSSETRRSRSSRRSGRRSRARGRASSSARPTGGSCARSRDPPERRARRRPEALRAARARRRGRRRTRSTATRWTGRKACRAARCRSSRRSAGDAGSARGDLALPARHRLDRDDRVVRCCRRITRCSSSSRRRGACGTGSATGCGCGSSTSARRCPAARIRRTASSCSTCATTFCPWNEGRWRLAGGAAERTDADADLALDVTVLGAAYPRRHPLRAARAGRPRRGAEAGRDRARRRHVPPRPASVVPGDLLGEAWAKLSPRPGRLAQLGEHQLDKLGVTGSSPVPPITRKPC